MVALCSRCTFLLVGEKRLNSKESGVSVLGVQVYWEVRTRTQGVGLRGIVERPHSHYSTLCIIPSNTQHTIKHDNFHVLFHSFMLC